jgi:hypothetical protein
MIVGAPFLRLLFAQVCDEQIPMPVTAITQPRDSRHSAPESGYLY